MHTLPEFDSHDDALLDELQAAVALALDVPVSFAIAAKACLTWRTIDAELDAASLCFDSALDGHALVRAPATLAPRSLAFEGDGIELDVEVRRHEVSGQIVPAQVGRVRLLGADGTVRATDTDESGWFAFAGAARGPHRFECESTAGATLITEWTVL